jgi:hypothetical protein
MPEETEAHIGNSLYGCRVRAGFTIIDPRGHKLDEALHRAENDFASLHALRAHHRDKCHSPTSWLEYEELRRP